MSHVSNLDHSIKFSFLGWGSINSECTKNGEKRSEVIKDEWLSTTLDMENRKKIEIHN